MFLSGTPAKTVLRVTGVVGVLALGLISRLTPGPGGQIQSSQEASKPTRSGPLPGSYRTHWVGNSFGGDGGPNGAGYWVQNGADEIEVTPDGTVIAGLAWDEAGRCLGLYREGKPNRELLKAEGDKLPDSAWGWGTGNNAVAVWKDTIYAATTGKKLLRFRWKPGDLESAAFLDAADLPGEAIGLAADDNSLALVYPGSVEIRRRSDLTLQQTFSVSDASDVAFAPDGGIWLLAGKTVRRFTREGKPDGAAVPDLEQPTAISFDHRGRLVICDNGPRQQVLFYDVAATPKLAATFGEKGGLRAGTPGALAPRKLFALRGAGTDEKGNLYVAMSFASVPEPEKDASGKVKPAPLSPVGTPAGNLFLRSFTPEGELRWELHSTAFVDTFGFDPDSDGSVVYSRTAIFQAKQDRDASPTATPTATPVAVTLDPLSYPDDPRIRYGGTTLLRRLQGRRALFFIGQYAGGYRIYSFDEPGGQLAHPVAKIGESEQWAWDVTLNGDIWHGDAPEKTIRRYQFRGWKGNTPTYDWGKPETWPWPEGWELVRRVLYDEASDTLYLTGYLKGQKIETWGVAGATVRRYENWLKGNRIPAWTASLPRDGNPDKNEGPLTPSSVDIAGDYLFAGMVKPTEGKQLVHVLRLKDGSFVGTFTPGKETGEGHGWLDMPYSLQAMRRKNGEYLVLVEEDWRGKNLLYRWRP